MIRVDPRRVDEAPFEDRDGGTSFEPWFPTLLRCAYLVGCRFRHGDAAFAEDVAQESLTRAFAAWDRIRGHPNLHGWITVTAFRVALELDRDQRRAARPSRYPTTDVAGADERLDDSDLLAHLLGRLPARQRQVLVWRYYFDRSVRQTAQQLRMTESAVKQEARVAVAKMARISHADRSIDTTQQPNREAA